jgi:hypothetical protein
MNQAQKIEIQIKIENALRTFQIGSGRFGGLTHKKPNPRHRKRHKKKTHLFRPVLQNRNPCGSGHE